jgi:NAD-dependent dihydropyrimidine dehydrogenase PreA subunit
MLPPPTKCCGCSACYAVCPKRAITMKPDAEGFLLPVIDKTLCVNCGQCQKVCPVLHPGQKRMPLAVYAAKAKDDELRMKSSSGGMFTLLAREILKQGGIVYGAGWEKPAWRVVHKSAENEEELDDLRGSKYVQSDMGDTFRQVKKQLDSGRQVLFSGCPCQIAGLKLFLQKPYDNLLCVDLICHGVPSPFVFDRCKNVIQANSAQSGEIKRISFRQKHAFGWKRFALSFAFANGSAYLQPLDQDPFLRGFLSELYSRLSCHECPFRELRSGSDITLADYWNVQQRFADMDDDKGVSLVLANSSTGLEWFNRSSSGYEALPSTYQHARDVNPSLWRSVAPSSRRGKFFCCFRAHPEQVQYIICACLRRPWWRTCGHWGKDRLRKWGVVR